jgi:hypothetical protein
MAATKPRPRAKLRCHDFNFVASGCTVPDKAVKNQYEFVSKVNSSLHDIKQSMQDMEDIVDSMDPSTPPRSPSCAATSSKVIICRHPLELQSNPYD